MAIKLNYNTEQRQGGGITGLNIDVSRFQQRIKQDKWNELEEDKQKSIRETEVAKKKQKNIGLNVLSFLQNVPKNSVGIVDWVGKGARSYGRDKRQIADATEGNFGNKTGAVIDSVGNDVKNVGNAALNILLGAKSNIEFVAGKKDLAKEYTSKIAEADKIREKAWGIQDKDERKKLLTEADSLLKPYEEDIKYKYTKAEMAKTAGLVALDAAPFIPLGKMSKLNKFAPMGLGDDLLRNAPKWTQKVKTGVKYAVGIDEIGMVASTGMNKGFKEMFQTSLVRGSLSGSTQGMVDSLSVFDMEDVSAGDKAKLVAQNVALNAVVGTLFDVGIGTVASVGGRTQKMMNEVESKKYINNFKENNPSSLDVGNLAFDSTSLQKATEARYTVNEFAKMEGREVLGETVGLSKEAPEIYNYAKQSFLDPVIEKSQKGEPVSLVEVQSSIQKMKEFLATEDIQTMSVSVIDTETRARLDDLKLKIVNGEDITPQDMRIHDNVPIETNRNGVDLKFDDLEGKRVRYTTADGVEVKGTIQENMLKLDSGRDIELTPDVKDRILNNFDIEGVNTEAKFQVDESAEPLTNDISKAKAEGKSFDEWAKGQQPIYHVTGKKFSKFKNEMGRTWFTDSIGQAKDGKIDGLKGEGIVMERYLGDLKLMAGEEASRYEPFVIQAKGYDGVLYKYKEGGNYIELFDGNKTKTKAQLKAEWDNAKVESNPKVQVEESRNKIIEGGSKLYHGTPNTFTGKPNFPFYLTSDKDYATVYKNSSASSLSTGKSKGKSGVMEFEVNPEAKILDLRTPEGERILEDYWTTMSVSGERVKTETGLPDWTEGEYIAEFIEENNLPFDAVLLDEGGTFSPDGVKSRGVAFQALNENAIRKTDSLIEEAKKYKSAEEFVKAKTPDNEYISVYHRTNTPLQEFGKKPIYSKENRGDFFVSNRANEQITGYGDNVLELRVKKKDLEINDEFPSGEEHYTIPTTVADDAIKTKAQLEEIYNKANSKFQTSGSATRTFHPEDEAFMQEFRKYSITESEGADIKMEAIASELAEKYDIKVDKQNNKSLGDAFATILDQEQGKRKNMADTVYKYFDKDEVDVKFVQSITTPKGQKALGVYFDDIITFAQDANNTTPEHEVLHAYFDMFTGVKRKSDVLGQVKKQQGLEGDLEAEEWLADNFVDFVRNTDKSKSLPDQIKIMFVDVWEGIKSLVGNEDKVRALYKDIISKNRDEIGEMAGNTMFQVQSAETDDFVKQLLGVPKGKTKSVYDNPKLKELQTKAEEFGSKRKNLERKIDESNQEIEAIVSALDNHPGKFLHKYANKKEGTLPELGSTNSIWARKGDDIATELGLKDSDEAQGIYQEWLDMRKTKADLEDEIEIAQTGLQMTDIRNTQAIKEMEDIIKSGDVGEDIQYMRPEMVSDDVANQMMIDAGDIDSLPNKEAVKPTGTTQIVNPEKPEKGTAVSKYFERKRNLEKELVNQKPEYREVKNMEIAREEALKIVTENDDYAKKVFNGEVVLEDGMLTSMIMDEYRKKARQKGDWIEYNNRSREYSRKLSRGGEFLKGADDGVGFSPEKVFAQVQNTKRKSQSQASTKAKDSLKKSLNVKIDQSTLSSIIDKLTC